jgi:predicted phage-related endonuclease
MSYVSGPKAHSPEWYSMRRYDPHRKERPVVIGASEAAAAMGLSKYQSPLELYLVKRGEYEPEWSQEQRDRMDYGTHMEPLILDRYSREVSPTIMDRKIQMCFSLTHSFCAATPDAMATSDGERYVVECKTTTGIRYDKSGENTEAFGLEGTDQIPIEYVIQCQQLMHVMGVDRVDVPVLFDPTTLRIYRVDRDNDLIGTMLDAEEELCIRIIEGRPPEPMMSHPGTLDLLKKTQPYRSWIVKEWSEHEASNWMQLRNHKDHIKSMEAITKTLETEVYASFGDAAAATYGDLRVKRIAKSNGAQLLKQV